MHHPYHSGRRNITCATPGSHHGFSRHPGRYLFLFQGKTILGTFRDGSGGKKKNRVHSVGWADGGGSPLHAWLFFFGFVLFPIWWVAGLLVRIPETRRIGDADTLEKGVVLDDPQVEHGELRDLFTPSSSNNR